jgi:hypothetical protein
MPQFGDGLAIVPAEHDNRAGLLDPQAARRFRDVSDLGSTAFACRRASSPLPASTARHARHTPTFAGPKSSRSSRLMMPTLSRWGVVTA